MRQQPRLISRRRVLLSATALLAVSMKPRPTGSAQAHARRIHAPAPTNNRDLSNQASTDTETGKQN
jgi:hypothetical protein